MDAVSAVRARRVGRGPARRRLLGAAALLLAAAVASPLPGQPDAVRRREHLELLQGWLRPSRPPHAGRINAQDTTWEDWLRRTGELPPDFAALPSEAFLPDPLISTEDGTRRRITTRAQWEQQRRWIRAQFEHWVFGRMPPAPGNLRVAATSERRDGTVRIRDVRLEFGPGHRATLNLQLMIPDGGPFPVFLTNHSRNRSPWVHTAVSRGYIACYYRAADPFYGDADDSETFIEAYPEYDFSCLARWAWAAARAVDYLVELPEVVRDQIGIAGHSRGGKQALLAAAFDERIGAAVGSSGLQGEALPHRYTSDAFVNESIQMVTEVYPHWFHPRLRFFSGREHKLPVDQNMLMALVAPRGLMLYSSHEESNSNAFALEQVYRGALETFRFLDRGDNFRLHLRGGDHGTEVGDVENFLDFFDETFGRRPRAKSEHWVHGYEFDAWQRRSGLVIDPTHFPVRSPGAFLRTATGAALRDPSEWESRQAELRRRLEWVLGEPPPLLSPKPAPRPDGAASRVNLGAASWPVLQRELAANSPPFRNPMELMSGRPQPGRGWEQRMAAVGMGMSSLAYGPGLRADAFYPVDGEGRRLAGRLPVAIWLHPYAHAVGWSAKFPWMPNRAPHYLDQRPSLDSLVRRGFVVVAFDQIGFGSRSAEGPRFYERHPRWSLLGKMVADTRAVIDAVHALEDVDSAKIHLVGYALGAKVALFAAALDHRVTSVAAVCGVSALRLDSPEKGTEGLRHYSHLHGLLPKLGFFLGQENRAPFDYDEVLALIAPRPVLVIAPEFDRFAPVEDVRQEVMAAREVYQLLGRADALDLRTPRDFNRFPRQLQEEVFDYLGTLVR